MTRLFVLGAVFAAQFACVPGLATAESEDVSVNFELEEVLLPGQQRRVEFELTFGGSHLDPRASRFAVNPGFVDEGDLEGHLVLEGPNGILEDDADLDSYTSFSDITTLCDDADPCVLTGEVLYVSYAEYPIDIRIYASAQFWHAVDGFGTFADDAVRDSELSLEVL